MDLICHYHIYGNVLLGRAVFLTYIVLNCVKHTVLKPFSCVAALPKTAKCKGYCTPCYNYHVSSESAWWGETLDFMCQTITETGDWAETASSRMRMEWKQVLMKVDSTRWWMQLLLRVKDRAKSNMRELVGHALEQKANGREDGSHVENYAAKSKTQRKWVKKLKEFKLGRRLVVC